VSTFSDMGDPPILAETIPHQKAKLNRPGEKAGARTRRSNKDSLPLGFCLFPVDGDGSVGYGKMIACSEWPIALRTASSASAIGGGP
jgi:hypothetical protein